MEEVVYIDRLTQERQVEKVYGEALLRLLYGHGVAQRSIGRLLRSLVTKNPYASALAGWWQRQPWTAKAVAPFIEKYGIDSREFLLNVADYRSFNDFFIRKLKSSARPIIQGKGRAVIPADGRYYFYADISKADGFVVKGQKFQLSTLLNDANLADQYRHATMVMARLCPTDYHRFHFPCDGIPGETHQIRGELKSVNPIAIRQNVAIFTQNKRCWCAIDTPDFGKVLAIEVGATAVGTIVQTYTPARPYAKGDEKGYFSFGGSSLILLFPAGSLQLDSDLLAATALGIEIRCLMGQSLGVAVGQSFTLPTPP
jgi:phosphatidylserine decarboxylase